jgi:sugar/nucleoside kinase (ribokinase family)
MSILAVGSVAYDSLKTPFGERERILGGSASYFSIGASLFNKINLVGVVGEDFDEKDIELFKSRNISLEGLVRKKGKTFFWKGEYGDNLNEAITHDTQLNVFAEFDPTIPENYKNSNMVFLGNIHPALQLKVLEQVDASCFTACDTMNLWINETPEILKKVLSKVNMAFVNDTEAKILTKESNVVKAAKKLLDFGLDYVCIKRGEYGSAVFGKSDISLLPAFPVDKVIDPTGAGDTFASGFLGYLSTCDNFDFSNFREALKVATVLSSFNIENFSVERLKTVTIDEVRERLEQFKKYIV